MAKRIDISGKKYCRLTAISREGYRNGKSFWLCKCDCGNLVTVSLSALQCGNTKSCGCLHRENTTKLGNANKTHGMTNTRIYSIWSSMKTRCKSKRPLLYKNYGGRGIKVCQEWDNSFEAFKNWALSHGYTDELTIDRIDNNKGYSPENCRWATYTVQENNRSNNVRITINGEEKTLSEWSRIIGISPETLRNRVSSGWRGQELFLSANLNNKNIRREIYGTK